MRRHLILATGALTLSMFVAATAAQAPQGAPPGGAPAAGAPQGRPGGPPGGGPPGGGPPGGGGRGRGPAVPPLLMTSTAWDDGGVIPDKYTAKGGPTSPNPALSWSQVPMGTVTFALIMHDPEPSFPAKSVKDITHWLIWNIPGTSTGLPEGVAQGDLPDGSKQQSLRGQGYMGPGAPAGPYHHYTFTLYALDAKLDVMAAQNAADTRAALLTAMEGHVLGKAVLVAKFHQ